MFIRSIPEINTLVNKRITNSDFQSLKKFVPEYALGDLKLTHIPLYFKASHYNFIIKGLKAKAFISSLLS